VAAGGQSLERLVRPSVPLLSLGDGFTGARERADGEESRVLLTRVCRARHPQGEESRVVPLQAR
jgi:hypothetical protein